MFRGLLATIFLAGAIVVFFTWTQPMLDSVKGLSEQKEILNEKLSSLKEIEKERENILDSYNSVGDTNREKVGKILPSSMKEMDLIVELENMAANSGVALKDVNISDAGKEQKSTGGAKTGEAFYPNEIGLIIKASGPYQSFKEFLKSIETNLRIIDIESLDFISGDVDSYEYNLKIKSYWKEKNYEQ